MYVGADCNGRVLKADDYSFCRWNYMLEFLIIYCVLLITDLHGFYKCSGTKAIGRSKTGRG